MTTYNANLNEDGVLIVGFGDPASNDQIVVDAQSACKAIKEQVSGKLLKISGPASLPAAMVICHEFCHLVPAIAVFDPKLQKFVVSVSHSPNYQLGQLIN